MIVLLCQVIYNMRWYLQKRLIVTSTDFEFLLCIVEVGHKFAKLDSYYRKAIPVRENSR